MCLWKKNSIVDLAVSSLWNLWTPFTIRVMFLEIWNLFHCVGNFFLIFFHPSQVKFQFPDHFLWRELNNSQISTFWLFWFSLLKKWTDNWNLTCKGWKKIRKKFPMQWKKFQMSRIITLIVNWVQRFQSELTAKFTIEFFFQRHILFYLHSKSTLIPVTTTGDFFLLIPPSTLAWESGVRPFRG